MCHPLIVTPFALACVISCAMGGFTQGASVTDHEWELLEVLQLDPVMTQQRIGLKEPAKLPPCGDKAIGSDALRKIGRKQRRVVITLILTEPAQPFGPTPRFDGERCDKGGFAVRIAADDDDRPNVVGRADMALPYRQPFEGLERRALGGLLEAAPFAFDSGKIGINVHAQVGRNLA